MSLENDKKYWVALSTQVEIGAKTFLILANLFDSMEEVWKSPGTKLKQKKIPDKIIQAINKAKSSKDPDDQWRKVEELDIKIITIKDKNYPPLLKEIPDRPAMLYLKGELAKEDDLAIAIVGSRKATSYGLRATEMITQGLSQSGITIVSGLALGIDALAHKTALENNTRTLAVLGSGLDQIYPTVNKWLADKIVKEYKGALISEFPLGMPSLKQNFPLRNRIIAGLSLGTVVTEGAKDSGSLITARCAIEYNREVFAVPGSIFNFLSEGPNHLIKMGAKIVLSSSDILEELNLSDKIMKQSAEQILPDTKEEAQILDILDKDQAIHVDKLVEKCGLDIAKLNSSLIMMEMKGKVRNIGGNLYVKR